jgi:hypothetical protein
MKRLVALIAASAVLVACGGGDDDDAGDEGVPFTSPHDDFTVSFPGEPETQSLPVQLPDGSNVEGELFLYSDNDIAAGVTRVDYGPGAETSLEGARDGAIANVGGELVDSQQTELQGRDGLEFSGVVEDGDQSGELLSTVYEDGTLLYQVIYTGRDIDFDDEEVAAFFDSFQFTEDR